MKKTLLVLIFFLSTLPYGRGQTNVYYPFPDTNAFWGDKGWNIFNSNLCYNTRYGINGDTVINGKNYSKIYSLFDSTLTSPKSSYYAAIREQNKRVYTVIDTFPEDLLYDFNLSTGDTITHHVSLIFHKVDTFSRVVTQIDSILLLDGTYRKRWTFDPASIPPHPSTNDIVVEGIGSIYAHGLFQPLINGFLTNGDNFNFECFKQNDTAFYVDNPLCNHCFCTLLTDIKKIKEEEKLLFFPNPFSTLTAIETNNSLKDATLTVYNLCGQQVKQITPITIGAWQSIILHRDNLPGGIYFYQLTENNKDLTKGKLVIAHD